MSHFSWIRTESEKRGLVANNILFAFLIGAAQTFLAVVPLAIFLTTYSSSYLTYVYMSLGVVVFLIGNVFKYYQKNLSFFKILLAPLITFAITLFLFWGMLVALNFKWVPMALFIWSCVAYTFLSLVHGTMIVRIFTLQEGKKFFGIFGGSRALGATVTGFLTPLLVKFIGPKTVFFSIPFIILAAIGTLFFIYNRYRDRFLETKYVDEKKAKSITFKTLKNRNYVLAIFALAIVSIFNYYSIDLLFNAEVKRHFTTERDIAGFLGIFTGIANILTLLSGFLLFGFVLDKLGLIITLFLTPSILGLFVASTILANFFSLEMVFGIFLVMALFERVLRLSLNGESLNLLYSPLPYADREWSLHHYRINIQSLCTSIIGALLFLIARMWGITYYSVLFFVLAICCCGIGTMLIVKRDYIRILIAALAKWALIKPSFTKLDKYSLQIFEGLLKSPFPDEVIFILQTIEKVKPKRFPKDLLEALDSPLVDVRIYALNKIEQYKLEVAEEKVKEICLYEKDHKILSAAFSALDAIADVEEFYWFREHLHSENAEIASNCFIALIRRGVEVEELLVKAPKQVIAMVLREVDIPNKADLLLPLLNDPIACEAAGDVLDERLYLALVENLAISHLHDASFHSLLKLSPTDYFFAHFDQFSHKVKIQLLNLLGWVQGHGVVEFLQKFLRQPDRSFFKAALSSLERHGFKAQDEDQIRSLLSVENRNILFLREILASIPEGKTPILAALIRREIELHQESCFALLIFIYPTELINAAREGLAKFDRDKNSFAIEILLYTLSKDDANQLVAQLAPMEPFKLEAPIEEVLLKMLDYSSKGYISALNSAVVYTIGVLGLKTLTEFVQKDEAPHDPYLAEIRPWTLKKLQI